MSNKQFTPKEAAIAVLKKAEEMYKNSSLAKAESKHDRCVKDVEQNSPGVKNAHAVCVAEGVKPAKWEKSEKPMEKKYEGFKAVEESAAKSGASDPAAVAAAESAHSGWGVGKASAWTSLLAAAVEGGSLRSSATELLRTRHHGQPSPSRSRTR